MSNNTTSRGLGLIREHPWITAVIVAGLAILLTLAVRNGLWIELGLLLTIPVLAIVAILLSANFDSQFTTIEQGSTVFIYAGQRLKAIWPNVGSYRLSEERDLDGRNWLISETKDEVILESMFRGALPGTKWLQKMLWTTFGVRFVSWFWPHTHKYRFEVSRKRLAEGSDVDPSKPMRARVVSSDEPDEVDSLLFLAPRPVFVNGVELAGDNSRVNLLLLCVWQQIIPALPAVYLRGDFFPQLDAAIEAALVDLGAQHRVAVYKGKNKRDERRGKFVGDYCPQTDAEKAAFKEQYGVDYDAECEPSPLTYSHWLKLAQAGKNSPLEKFLRPLNISRSYYDTLKARGTAPEIVTFLDEWSSGEFADIEEGGEVAREIPSGIIPRFGFGLKSVRIIGREAHPDTIELAQALLKREIKFHEAAGVRQEAFGERDAIAARTTGEATRFRSLVEALVSKGVDENLAAEVVRTYVRTENISKSKITTYVEGEASASVMVPASAGDSSPPNSNQTSTR